MSQLWLVGSSINLTSLDKFLFSTREEAEAQIEKLLEKHPTSEFYLAKVVSQCFNKQVRVVRSWEECTETLTLAPTTLPTPPSGFKQEPPMEDILSSIRKIINES